MRKKFYKFIHYLHVIAFAPISVLFLLKSEKIHPSYRISLFTKFALGFKMLLNTIRIPAGSSYKLHLAMALKILETPPEIAGDIVECGTWKGASAANLSLVCRIVGRKLKVFDSFQGLPAAKPGDREGQSYRPGDYKGDLEEVKRNITKCGSVEACEFYPGWFHETLPLLNSPVLLAYIDVDLEDSLDTCVKHLWRNLVDCSYLFTDECLGLNYVALFYSEKWWQLNFNRTPPGLIGAGTGLPLGTYYIGPYAELESHPLQHQGSGGYTMKTMSGFWSYYPDKGAQEGSSTC
jgi:O-methyltransferase